VPLWNGDLLHVGHANVVAALPFDVVVLLLLLLSVVLPLLLPLAVVPARFHVNLGTAGSGVADDGSAAAVQVAEGAEDGVNEGKTGRAGVVDDDDDDTDDTGSSDDAAAGRRATSFLPPTLLVNALLSYSSKLSRLSISTISTISSGKYTYLRDAIVACESTGPSSDCVGQARCNRVRIKVVLLE
jgi:hypothetical protein